MSWWDKAQATLKEQGTKLIDNAAEGAVDASIKSIMGVFTEKERAAHQGFERSASQQTATRHAREVEYQNNGAPMSFKDDKPQRRLVGDKNEDAKRDKKLMYIGGGVAVVAVIALAVYVAKK